MQAEHSPILLAVNSVTFLLPLPKHLLKRNGGHTLLKRFGVLFSMAIHVQLLESLPTFRKIPQRHTGHSSPAQKDFSAHELGTGVGQYHEVHLLPPLWDVSVLEEKNVFSLCASSFKQK